MGCVVALAPLTAATDAGGTTAVAVLAVPDGTFTCSPLVDVFSRAPGQLDRS
jgi:hypothetical protein